MDFLATIDWAAILKIVGVDIMLGADNAVVIALACASLAPELRKQAVFWGAAGAIGLRAILLALAGLIMGVLYVKLVAGAFLLYIGYKRLMSGDEEEQNINASDRLLGAIKTIIVADLMMSIDNVFAVVGAANSAGAHSTAYAIAGIALSVPIIIFAAGAITKIMDRFPIVIWAGAGLLGWIGAEMMISDPVLVGYIERVHHVAGDYTHLSYKIAGFIAVIFTAFAAQRAIAKRELAAEAA